MTEKFKTLIEFITEQNRLDRTGGLPITHSNGEVMPCDTPMSSEEVAYWEQEEKKYQKMVQEWFKDKN